MVTQEVEDVIVMIMKETTSGISFYPVLSVLSWRTSLKVAVDGKVTNEDVISAVVDWVTTVKNNKTQRTKELIC